MTYTKGPWKTVADLGGKYYIIANYDEVVGYETLGHAKRKADAIIMSLAPEMFGVLETINSCFTHNIPFDPSFPVFDINDKETTLGSLVANLMAKARGGKVK